MLVCFGRRYPQVQKPDLLRSLPLTLLTRILLIWKKVGHLIQIQINLFHSRHHVWTAKWQYCFHSLSANIDPSRRYLYLQVLGGKAFLEHLQEPEPLPGQVCSTFTLFLHLRNQRFRSKPVPCSCEPDLKEGFLLEIHGDGTGTSELAVFMRLLNLPSVLSLSFVSTLALQEKVVKWRTRPPCFLCATRFTWCWSGRTPSARRRWSRPTFLTGGQSSPRPVGRPALLWSWWELVRRADPAAVNARATVFTEFLFSVVFYFKGNISTAKSEEWWMRLIGQRSSLLCCSHTSVFSENTTQVLLKNTHPFRRTDHSYILTNCIVFL